MTPLVSIILPCYNHEAYVRAALDSALRQTLVDIQVIAIDDASTDATAVILESFDDPRLTVIRHERNQGSALTLNEGVRLARAPYVAILNSDDLFEPTRLAECIEYARHNDTWLLGTDLNLINAAGEVVGDRSHWWLEWYRGLRETFRMSGDLAGTLITGNIFISTSNFFIDRRLFESIGYLADYRYVQDYEFLLRAIAAHPLRVAWLEKTLMSYRLHDRNTIMEDQLLPAQQTVEVLARWMPDLAVGERAKSRLHQFEGHLLRLSKYIENGANTRMRAERQAEVVVLQAQHAEQTAALDCSLRELGGERDELVNRLAALQTDNEALHGDIAMQRKVRESLEREVGWLKGENNRLGLANAALRKIEEGLCNQIEGVYASRSYQLGYLLLQPLRWLFKFLGLKKRPN